MHKLACNQRFCVNLKVPFDNLCLGGGNAIVISIHYQWISLVYGFALELSLHKTGLDHHEQGRWQSLVRSVPIVNLYKLTVNWIWV